MDIFALAVRGVTAAAERTVAEALLECTGGGGLWLTEAECGQLARARTRLLGENTRVELVRGAADADERQHVGGAMTRLAELFRHSSYIERDEFAYTLEALAELLWHIKTETRDAFGDAELARWLYERFEGSAGGDLDTLAERDVEALLRTYRGGGGGGAFDRFGCEYSAPRAELYIDDDAERAPDYLDAHADDMGD